MKPLNETQKEINRDLKILYPEASALSAQEFNDKRYQETIQKLLKLKQQPFPGYYFHKYDEYYLELALRHIDRELIQDINKELQEYFPDARPISDIEFVVNKDIKNIIITLNDFDGNFQRLENLYKIIAIRPPFERLSNYDSIVKAIQNFFQFNTNSNKALLDQLIDIEYLSTVISPYMEDHLRTEQYAQEYLERYYLDAGLVQDNYDNYVPFIPMLDERDRWIEYCQMIDSAISFINNKFPTWNKMKKSEKNKYIEQLKLYQELDFLEKNDKLDLYIDFLEHYTLHKNGSNAKSAFLLTLNLPKIDTIEIAKEVTKNSQIILNNHLQASYGHDNEANYNNDIESESNQSGYYPPSYK